jgi:Leucine-rich repeat (LRR) protein
LDLSNLRLLLIHDHTHNVSTDFQLFKAPLSHDKQRPCQLKIIFINGNFQQLPRQLWELHSLKSFDIEGLEMMEALPEALGNLTSLTHLNFSRCKRLRTLPNNLGNLTSLIELHLTGCSSLTTLPERLRNITSLTDIHLWGCLSLKTLPHGLGDLTSLTKLNFGDVGYQQKYHKDLQTSTHC